MNTQQIAQIAASVLYLDDPAQIDSDKSLFKDYGMSSLDFVDFAYEIKAASQKEFDPDSLWPITSMMNDRNYFVGGEWTDAGRAELGKLMDGFHPLPTSLKTEELYSLFSVKFVEHRLGAL